MRGDVEFIIYIRVFKPGKCDPGILLEFTATRKLCISYLGSLLFKMTGHVKGAAQSRLRLLHLIDGSFSHSFDDSVIY